jgi:hypothetical protein
MEKYLPEECDPSLSDEEYIKRWRSKENREKFLFYLLKLLKEGQLKVKVRTPKELPLTEEEKREKVHRKWGYENEIEYSSPEQAEVAIEDIRRRWNAITTDEYLDHFEHWCVLFTLPENEWIL